jgi:uncharacterized repeat protein (TIGR01451 family)/fimbrial isopeptide formation D2 family protein
VAAAQLTASQAVSVQQPLLAVAKTASAGADTPIVDAGEVVTYTVDIVNTGAAPAYDAVLVDTLPAGLRGGLTVTSISLVNAGTSLPLLAPAYDPATGVATWNFDNGTADSYTIPAGDTLRVVYTVTADTGLGAGLTLTNAAQATVYYSFDDEAVPAGGAAAQREVYAPTNTANETLITQSPNPPLKENPLQPTATIGEQFTYTLTVPATPVNVALSDVRILDDLSLSSADLAFVSAKIQGGADLQNTGTTTNIVLGADGSIDVPADGQVVVEITVALQNTTGNNAGLAFNNSASYTYINGSGVQVSGGASVTAD